MEFNIRKYFEKYSAFFKGMASVFDIEGGYYRPKPLWTVNNLTSEEQDELAIREDWEEVENNSRISMSKSKKYLSADKDLSKKVL